MIEVIKSDTYKSLGIVLYTKPQNGRITLMRFNPSMMLADLKWSDDLGFLPKWAMTKEQSFIQDTRNELLADRVSYTIRDAVWKKHVPYLNSCTDEVYEQMMESLLAFSFHVGQATNLKQGLLDDMIIAIIPRKEFLNGTRLVIDAGSITSIEVIRK